MPDSNLPFREDIILDTDELAGRRIRAGDLLGLFYASGGRDEEILPSPFEFRVDRQPNKHVSFGSGPHICLGMVLARMEVRIFFDQFLSRLKSIELAGEPRLIKSSFIHGVKHLPVRYRLNPAS